jgi:hypothetical protein
MKPLIFILGLVIGGVGVYFFIPPEKVEVESSNLELRLKALAENEMLQYAKIQDADEKLKKADKLYGEILKILLVNLSLKLDKSQYDLTPVVTKETVMEMENSERAEPIPTATLVGTASPPPVPVDEKSKPKTYASLKYADSPGPGLRRIQGRFMGQLVRMTGDKKGQIDKVELNINFQMSPKKVEGDFLCELTDPSGFSYSRMNGNGSNNHVKVDPLDQNNIYLTISPSDFMQLKFSGRDRMTGFVYSAGPLMTGKVQLWRAE